MSSKIKILKSYFKVKPYIDEIMLSADENRKNFGFMPYEAYEGSAQRDETWVIICGSKYVGHIVFGGKQPYYIRVFQIYIKPSYCGKGLGSLLLKELEEFAEKNSCLTIKAEVAEDLIDAIRFYQWNGFNHINNRKNRSASQRDVYIFVKNLNTPSLIIDEAISLDNIFTKIHDNFIPNFVIDLNVFLGLMKKRDYVESISGIIKGALSGELNIFVTPEFKEEILRCGSQDDGLLDLASQTFPVLSPMDDQNLLIKEKELRPIIFPERSRRRKNSEQDKSDLRHIVYCIQNRIEGFITFETALLKSSSKLYDKYGLKVLSPKEFCVDRFSDDDVSSLAVPLELNGNELIISDSPERSEVDRFLGEFAELDSGFRKIIKSRSVRGYFEEKGIKINKALCGLYRVKTRGVKHDNLEGYFVATEGYHLLKIQAFEHILEHFSRTSQRVKPKQISLYINEGMEELEHICFKRGYNTYGSSLKGMVHLKKIPAPLLISKANWNEFREGFQENAEIEFPFAPPLFRVGPSGFSEMNLVEKQRCSPVSVFDLETLLSPSIFLLPKRKGLVVSIRPGYSESLLSRPENILPFPISQGALLRIEKAYFRSPKGVKNFQKGMPIIFYESGNGRGAIGCARITTTEIVDVENAIKVYRRNGVLSKNELKVLADKKNRIHVVTFDNFKEFVKPVSLKMLHEIGCGKANFVGPEIILDKVLSRVLHIGMDANIKDVVLSIHPKYVSKILSGKKVVELRKKPLPVPQGTRLWIYSASPDCRMEATAKVVDVEEMGVDKLWEKYEKKCGISSQKFDEYFSGCAIGYGIILSDPKPLKRKVKLSEIKQKFKEFNPPQYYRYLEHESDLFNELVKNL